MQRIVLLHLITDMPQDPCEITQPSEAGLDDEPSERVLNTHQEKELVEAFTFLASINKDPRKVIAVSVEEIKSERRLIVRLAANHGGLVTVQQGLRQLAKTLEGVARRGALTTVSSMSRHTLADLPRQ